jgi:coupling of ubiquitin conjugation to ER degradation protein 1
MSQVKLVTCTRINSFDPDAIMGEVLNVIVAFAVIVFAVRWATKGPLHLPRYLLLVPTPFLGKDQPNSPGAVLGFRPKNVTDEMVHTFL